MKNDKAFQKLFWGFLLIWIDVYVIVDVFADPIGYYLIYSGIKLLVREFPIAKKSEFLAMILVIISAPSLFIKQPPQPPTGFIYSAIDWYYTIISFANFLLIYFIFQLIIAIASKCGKQTMVNWSKTIGITYFVIMFIIHLSSSFAINLRIDDYISFAFLVAALIIHCVFLMLVDEARKLKIERN
ncbi:hypothetical protein [Ureibacillus manganicus]|uniref:Uncharacterized protein n=1 Tax=Ureibacillus manganicus DSM 26584 TaxID=1384049 RepID=A0A0A3IQZ2_9BACL|nr:hypothetical protein [Ureibacillus manganicus]KGR77242.1 hypothetical protein CD29_15360 [Ureibacillus manganicus DSM 26584]